MTDEERILVQEVIQMTIRELKRNGMLKEPRDTAYPEISARLRAFYKDGGTDEDMRRALAVLAGDKYSKIIPLYFDYGYTIEEIAEVYGVEVSTITRNKKRLCLRVHNMVT